MAKTKAELELEILRRIVSQKELWNYGCVRGQNQGWHTVLVKDQVHEEYRKAGLEWGGPYGKRAEDEINSKD